MTKFDAVILTIVILAAIYFIIWDIHNTDKVYRVRYAPIKHRMKPGILYPRWRLEEMLKEELP